MLNLGVALMFVCVLDFDDGGHPLAKMIQPIDVFKVTLSPLINGTGSRFNCFRNKIR